MQLGAAILALFVLAVSARPDKAFQLKQLGKIIVGLIAGTIAGILIMLGVCGLMSLH